MERKFSLKKCIKIKIRKANAHDLKKSEYLMASPIIKKGRGLNIEYNCGDDLKNSNCKTNINSVE